MTEELKACPFCGGDAEMDTQQGYTNFATGRTETGIAIYCRDCGAQHMICRGDVPDIEPEHVIELWNRRAPSPGGVEGREPDAVERATGAFIQSIIDQGIQIAGDDLELKPLFGDITEEQREFCSIAIRAALVAASPVPPAEGWRPIETALRNGTHIILAFGQDHSSEGWYVDSDDDPRPWRFLDIGDHNAVFINSCRDDQYGPSHWQPMPHREPRNRPSPPIVQEGG